MTSELTLLFAKKINYQPIAMIVTKSAVTPFKNGIKLSLTEKLNLPSSWSSRSSF